MKKNRIMKRTLTMLLAFAMVTTMMPALGIGAQNAYADSATAPGGMVASNNAVDLNSVKGNTVAAATAFGSSNVTASYDSTNRTLTITLNTDITLSSPVRFVMGESGGKIVLDLNGHTITGRAGIDGTDTAEAIGGNAIEIAADAFDVEIKGPGSVAGGKGAKLDREDYNGYRVGTHGGSAVFFCERVDKVHDMSGSWGDINDEGYHPDKLEHGLTVTGGANLVGGAGADLDLGDWKHNLNIGYFGIEAGEGGSAISQIFSGTETEAVLEELSYAKIVIENGSVTGGTGGGVDTGDQLLTRTDIMKIAEIQQFMDGKEAGYDFDSNVTDAISFVPADGGNGIEFFAGRKYIEIGSSGSVTGGSGGRYSCSERASMVKQIDTKCGEGGEGIYVCGDTGLTNSKPDLSAGNWSNKSKNSDDAGIYIAGTVTGGSSPSTTLLSDSSGDGGIAIDCELDSSRYLCSTYSVSQGHNPTFDADRGIVLVANGGKVIGGSSGASDETTISGGLGADAIRGGSAGGVASGRLAMTAAYYVINGEVVGGYGSRQGGSGFRMASEKEYLDDTQSSAYFGAVLYGSGSIKGGDSGEWPYLGQGYSEDTDGSIIYDGEKIVGTGIDIMFGYHDGATTTGPDLIASDGVPARLMKTNGTFKVTPTMTPFATGTAPTSATKLRADVTTPAGYSGKVYITWSAEYEKSTPRYIRRIEGANGSYNNISILSNSDYPYGWKVAQYGDSNYYTYSIQVTTLEHLAEQVKYNDNTEVHIYCHALLEDGRFVDNEDIWFSRNRRSSKGWGGSGGGEGGDEGGDGQAAIDQEAADAVMTIIEALPNLGDITPDDEETINAAREAYDALTPAQKKLLEPYTYLLNDLEAAEARIRELKGDAGKVEELADQINELADADAIGAMTEEEAQAEAKKMAGIYEAYAEFNDDQQKMLSENEETLEKLKEADDALIEKLADAEEPYEHTHLMRHVPEKAGTCKEEGNIEYYYCLICDDGINYSDAGGTQEITGSVETDTDPDNHDLKHINARAATCRSTGIREHYKCALCGTIWEDETLSIEIVDEGSLTTDIDPDGHEWKKGANKTNLYTDYYQINRTDTCALCNKTRSVVVKKANYKKSLPKVSVAKGKAGKKKLTAKWKKVSKKNQKKIGGIEIQVNGPGVKNKVYKAGKSKTSKAITVPKAKKSYKYRVRAYKGSGTGKQVSKWSGWKTVKVK